MQHITRGCTLGVHIRTSATGGHIADSLCPQLAVRTEQVFAVVLVHRDQHLLRVAGLGVLGHAGPTRRGRLTSGYRPRPGTRRRVRHSGTVQTGGVDAGRVRVTVSDVVPRERGAEQPHHDNRQDDVRNRKKGFRRGSSGCRFHCTRCRHSFGVGDGCRDKGQHGSNAFIHGSLNRVDGRHSRSRPCLSISSDSLSPLLSSSLMKKYSTTTVDVSPCSGATLWQLSKCHPYGKDRNT